VRGGEAGANGRLRGLEEGPELCQKPVAPQGLGWNWSHARILRTSMPPEIWVPAWYFGYSQPGDFLAKPRHGWAPYGILGWGFG
jgi:hypothetical protein